jgi:hypothetical protein
VGKPVFALSPSTCITVEHPGPCGRLRLFVDFSEKPQKRTRTRLGSFRIWKGAGTKPVYHFAADSQRRIFNYPMFPASQTRTRPPAFSRLLRLGFGIDVDGGSLSLAKQREIERERERECVEKEVGLSDTPIRTTHHPGAYDEYLIGYRPIVQYDSVVITASRPTRQRAWRTRRRGGGCEVREWRSPLYETGQIGPEVGGT